MNRKRELSTLGSTQLKKKEWEKRHSPLTIPYREKGKEKETSPGYQDNPLSPRGRARTRESAAATNPTRDDATRRYREAGNFAAQIIEVLNAKDDYVNNLKLWAFYCYHFDAALILDKAYECASRQRQGEIKNAVTTFQHWLKTTFPRKEVR